jgi:hypothetical protein
MLLYDQQDQAKSHLQVSVAAAATTMALMPEIPLPRNNCPYQLVVPEIRYLVADLYWICIWIIRDRVAESGGKLLFLRG